MKELIGDIRVLTYRYGMCFASNSSDRHGQSHLDKEGHMKSTTLQVCMAMFLIAGCSHTIPQSATKPQAPPQLGKTPPVIQPLSAGHKQAQAPESLLPVTLTTDLAPLEKSIKSAMPERF